MQGGGYTIFRRCVRIGASALVILGALALGQEHARAQLGVDTLRQVVDKTKAGKAVPGKGVLKGKSVPNVKGPLPKGVVTKGPATKGVPVSKDRLPGDKAKDL